MIRDLKSVYFPACYLLSTAVIFLRNKILMNENKTTALKSRI